MNFKLILKKISKLKIKLPNLINKSKINSRLNYRLIIKQNKNCLIQQTIFKNKNKPF